MHDSGNVPPPSEPWTLQWRGRRTASHTRDCRREWRVCGRCGDRDRRTGGIQVIYVQRARTTDRFVSQLRKHAANRSVIKRMTRIPADIYKLVTTARKPSDAARVLAGAKSSTRNKMVVLAMGELGFPTRVLSTAWGGIFTYAAPMHSQGTASGQVNAKQLRHLYRIEKFTKAAKVYGVIADPVRHSLSPVIHNRAFQSRRLDAVYLPVSGDAAATARLLRKRGKNTHRWVQRHHSSQAEDHPLSRRRGSSGAAHRRGKHSLEEGRQMARHEYRRRPA